MGDLFDALIELRDSAETANANAQEIIRRYRQKPVFHANSRGEHIRRAQKRAFAKKRLQHDRGHVERISKSVRDFQDVDPAAVDLVRRAVSLNAPSIFVGDLSYPTAHEAAMALGEVVFSEWQDAGGYDAIEYAPDRLNAGADTEDADLAIEVSLDIWQRLGKLASTLPPDLYGSLQQEFEAAWNLLLPDPAKGIPGRPGRPEIKKERNKRIRELHKEHKIGNKWAKLAELANEDDEVRRLNDNKDVTRHDVRNAILGRRKSGAKPK